MHEALVRGDRERYRASLTGPDGALDVLDATFDFAQAGYAFQDRFVATYGQKAWQTFQSEKGVPGSKKEGTLNVHLNLPERDGAWLNEVKVQTDGDTARCTAPDAFAGLQWVKEGPDWRLCAETFGGMGEGHWPEQAKLFRGLAAVVRDMTPRIGKATPPEEIEKEMAKRLRSSMF